jgi:hypothetical protein
LILKLLALLTPIGGGLLIAAWCVLVYQNLKIIKIKNSNNLNIISILSLIN